MIQRKERASWRNLRSSPSIESWKFVSLKLTEHATDHQQRPCVFLQFDDDVSHSNITSTNCALKDPYLGEHILSCLYTPVVQYRRSPSAPFIVARSRLFGYISPCVCDATGFTNCSNRSYSLQYTSSISSGHPNRSEPIYIRFPTPESLDTWLVLLRTYTTPELYGASFATPLHGGLYRMWRGVELRLLGGRNVGVSLFGSGSKSYKEVPHDDLKAYVRTGYGGGANSLHDVPGLTKEEIGDSPDQELFCEVVICGEVSGRSNVIRGGGVASWNEDFIFSDLPPFAMSTDARSDNSILRIIAYRRSTRSLNFDRLVHKDLRGKKSSHPPSISPGVNSSASSPHILSTSPTADISTPGATMIGFVEISLANFRRGDPIEGFFPIISPISTVNGSGGIHLGDLRLNIIVQE